MILAFTVSEFTLLQKLSIVIIIPRITNLRNCKVTIVKRKHARNLKSAISE